MGQKRHKLLRLPVAQKYHRPKGQVCAERRHSRRTARRRSSGRLPANGWCFWDLALILYGYLLNADPPQTAATNA